MKGKITDNNESVGVDESVQEYLDLMLTRATEDPAAQVEMPPLATDSSTHSVSETVSKMPSSSGMTAQITETAKTEKGMAFKQAAIPQGGILQETISEETTPQKTIPRRRRKDKLLIDVGHKSHEPVSPRDNTISEALKPIAPMAAASTTKPFAEPAASLKINMALPEVKADPQRKEAKADETVLSRPQVSFPRDRVPESVNKTPEVVAKTVAKHTAEPAPVIDDVKETAANITDAVSESQKIEPSVWLANGRPVWAQERFECLLFRVGGLTLAVPLAELGTIYPYDEDVTSLFGQIDWFLGLLTVKDINIRVVNTAKVVMPERYQETMKDNLKNVISISGVDWGLAVDSVSDSILLDPEDIRWRGQRSKRPWLAGTVIEHMCALLDVSQLAIMFLEQDRQRSH